MRIACWLTGVAALLALISGSQAAEKFAPKFVENSKQVKEFETKIDQTLTLAGMPLETKVTALGVLETVAGARDAEGKLSVVDTTKVLQVELNIPGGMKLQFDSGNPGEADDNSPLKPLADVFRAIVKHPVTTVVDRDNKIESARFADAAQDQLPKEVQSYVTPEKQKKEQVDAWQFLPDKEVNVGDEWERYIDKDLGAGQTMNFKMKYAYAGPETKDGKSLHKFTAVGLEVTYTLDANANPMVQCTKSDLKIKTSSGTILYDPATGEIPLRDSSVNVIGTLTLVINGQEFPGELDLTLTEKSKLQK